MEIVAIPLITQNIYESFILDIDNVPFIAELNTHHANVTSKLNDIYDWDACNVMSQTTLPSLLQLKEGN